MEPDLFPTLRPEITFSKIVATFVTITIFFALPAWAINSYFIQNTPHTAETTGQVAGVTSDDTIKSTNVNLFNLTKLDTQPQIFIIGGTILIGIAIIVILYLLIDQQKQKLSK
jgi:hypothetical protein